MIHRLTINFRECATIDRPTNCRCAKRLPRYIGLACFYCTCKLQMRSLCYFTLYLFRSVLTCYHLGTNMFVIVSNAQLQKLWNMSNINQHLHQSAYYRSKTSWNTLSQVWQQVTFQHCVVSLEPWFIPYLTIIYNIWFSKFLAKSDWIQPTFILT